MLQAVRRPDNSREEERALQEQIDDLLEEIRPISNRLWVIRGIPMADYYHNYELISESNSLHEQYWRILRRIEKLRARLSALRNFS